MDKKSNLLVILLVITCCTLAMYIATGMTSYSSVNIEACGNNEEKDDDKNLIKDLDSLKGDFSFNQEPVKTFDVADFAEGNINTIDIVSKEYAYNTITVLDSDFIISEELQENIYSAINSYGSGCSFYIVSLLDGMSVGFNIDKSFETASSIKAPYALYLYEEIAKGNIDSEALIEYQAKHYNKGTGVVKRSEFGTNFSVKDLIYYSLYESDNVAHTMLHSTFGASGYNEFLRNLGTKQLYLTAGNPWGFTSARSAALIWQEIYNFSLRDELGIEFLNILSDAKYNYFKEIMPDIPSAGKAGFASHDVVETGIVFDKHPYIGVSIANRGGSIGAYSQVLKIIGYMNDIMIEYDNYLNAK